MGVGISSYAPPLCDAHSFRLVWSRRDGYKAKSLIASRISAFLGARHKWRPRPDMAEEAGEPPGVTPSAAWLPTSTAATRFFRLPTTEHPVGAVYGVDAASSLSGDQSGQRIVGYATWVSVAPHTLLLPGARCTYSLTAAATNLIACGLAATVPLPGPRICP